MGLSKEMTAKRPPPTERANNTYVVSSAEQTKTSQVKINYDFVPPPQARRAPRRPRARAHAHRRPLRLRIGSARAAGGGPRKGEWRSGRRGRVGGVGGGGGRAV